MSDASQKCVHLHSSLLKEQPILPSRKIYNEFSIFIMRGNVEKLHVLFPIIVWRAWREYLLKFILMTSMASQNMDELLKTNSCASPTNQYFLKMNVLFGLKKRNWFITFWHTFLMSRKLVNDRFMRDVSRLLFNDQS